MTVFCIYVRAVPAPAPPQPAAPWTHPAAAAWQIYNRQGVCLYYKEWSRPHMSSDSERHDQKLMFGFLFSLKQLVAKMSPKLDAKMSPIKCALQNSVPCCYKARCGWIHRPPFLRSARARAQVWRLLRVQHKHLQDQLLRAPLRPALHRDDRPRRRRHAREPAPHLLQHLCRVPREEPAVAARRGAHVPAVHADAR